MRLNYVGIVVQNLPACGESLMEGSLDGRPISPIYPDPIQKGCIQFWKNGVGNLLELIEPAAPDSPVHGVLKKGGGLSHLCYEVDDLDEEVRLALEQGAIPASPVAPAVAFSGRRVAFVFFPKLDLVEFLEAERR